MRTITVKIPRLPAVAPTPEAAEPVFGPLGWELFDGTVIALSDQFDIGSGSTVDYVVATCPGAVEWRSEPEGLVLGITGAGAVEPSVDCSVYAISATGAELGPITLVFL